MVTTADVDRDPSPTSSIPTEPAELAEPARAADAGSGRASRADAATATDPNVRRRADMSGSQRVDGAG